MSEITVSVCCQTFNHVGDALEVAKQNGISIILLEVHEDSTRALAFYEKHLFKKKQKTKGSHILMEREVA
jgi:ribosomal protein S18 acetylase RimI-like enzyme